jgi:hypothetical protein
MLRNFMLTIGLLLSTNPISAFAQNATLQSLITVQSLINDGFTVAGVITSSAGPGVFLQKGNALLVCFIAEKPGSPTVETQYCKPVK